MQMPKNLLIYVSILIFCCTNIYAQTFSGTGDTIPDDGTPIEFEINVSGIPDTIDITNFGLEKVCFDLLHTYDADMRIHLIAPDGTIILLLDGCGGGDDNFINTCLNDQSNVSILTGTAPFTGLYKPIGQIGMVNNFQNPNGIWKLRILDTYAFADFGILNSWEIDFSNTPSVPTFFDSTFLPMVQINTYGQFILDDPKINAAMKWIDNGVGNYNHRTDSANVYNGFIGIEIRGHSSQMFPQKSYSIELRDTFGNAIDTPLAGFPNESDFILHGPYTDKSLMRNVLTCDLANKMGRYASRTKYVELIVNDEYQGIYVLMENIKRGNGRVDIAKLDNDDLAGDSLTGGYICKFDWGPGLQWNSNYPPDPVNVDNNIVEILMHYPKDGDIMPQQFQYIKNYVDSFETALYSTYSADLNIGWRKYGEEYSFIDFLLLNELSKNVDGYRLSSFFYKKKDSDGGKLHMGPVWDFNLAWHNADYCNNQFTAGWAYRITDYCAWDMPAWWKKFVTDANFITRTRCRWNDLRQTVLDTNNLFFYIDSVSNYLSIPAQSHYDRWPILGVYVWPNPNPLAQTYNQEIASTKKWIAQRIAWLDANIPGTCTSAGVIANQNKDNNFKCFPSPTVDELQIIYSGFDATNCVLNIIDDKGSIVKTIAHNFIPFNTQQISVDVKNISSGIYAVLITNTEGETKCLKFMKQ